jgi:hypothetical protein
LTILQTHIGFLLDIRQGALMPEGISIPAALLILFLIALLGIGITRTARKKRFAAELVERNLSQLSPEFLELYQTCKEKDAEWNAEYGTTLDATELNNDLERAVDAGWSAVDRAHEFLQKGDFSADTTLSDLFIAELKLAHEKFSVADTEASILLSEMEPS